MLTEFPTDARLLLRSDLGSNSQPFSKKARIILKYIDKLERPTMSDDHPFCSVYDNHDVVLGLACISAIRVEICAGVSADSYLPRAIHSRLGSIGLPILEWCLWVLKDMTFALTNCGIHNTARIEAATEALVVLSGLIRTPRGLQLVLCSESRHREVVEIAVHAWASSAALAVWCDAVFPSTILIDTLNNASPELHDLVLESLERYTTPVPLYILRHVAAFSHRDLEPLPDPNMWRRPVDTHIQLLTLVCQIYSSSDSESESIIALFIRNKAAKWVCRAFARVLTIPFEQWETGGVEREMLVHPFDAILTFLDMMFTLDLTFLALESALRHGLVRSLVRCISALSRQRRLGQGKTEDLRPIFDTVISRVCVRVRMSGSVLRLACRAMERLDLALEEKERTLSKDRDSVVLWLAWDHLKTSIAEARKAWVVDPNERSGRRCMNPLCTTPYARRLKRCADCQSVVVCSRRCQEYIWTTLDHRSHCSYLASRSAVVQQLDEEHDFENCRCRRCTLI